MAELEAKQVTLLMGDGALDELFQDAMQKALENIQDPNTDWDDKRRIMLQFEITCDEERRVGNIDISITTKLAPVKRLTVGVYFGKHEGMLMAVEAPRQKEMFPSPAAQLREVKVIAAKGVTP